MYYTYGLVFAHINFNLTASVVLDKWSRHVYSVVHPQNGISLFRDVPSQK